MLEYLYNQKVISSRIDIVSLGGSNDVGENFGEFNDYNDRNLIIQRIKDSGITFLYEKNAKISFSALIAEKSEEILFQ